MYDKPGLKSYAADDLFEILGPCQNYYTTTLHTTTGNSTVNVDGAARSDGACEADEGIYAGDDGDNLSIRGLVGFDLSSIQSTVISATLSVYQVGVEDGTPYTDLGTIVVDHVNFGSSIDGGDYSGGTLTSNIGTISTNATTEWKTLDVKDYVQADLDAGRTSSQFRLRFTTDTDNNGDLDAVVFEDAEDSAGTGNGPQLVVTYQ